MMTQVRRPIAGVLVAAFVVAVPLTADAHRQWLLPSATILSGKDPWVTVDAAVSNDLFYFEHNPMRLVGLAVTNPDGSAGKVENQATGKYRSTFDIQLAQPGTYKVAVVNNGVFARYKEGGQQKRWMGSVEAFATAIPANAEDLNVSEAQRRVETFVTAGKPSTGVLKPTGVGLELTGETHPNDLVAKGAANFQLVLDGKPAADVEVEVVPGGIRYRDKLDDIKVKTDAQGKFSITWPAPGMYWMEASVADKNVKIAKATQRRASYVATFEVMPE